MNIAFNGPTSREESCDYDSFHFIDEETVVNIRPVPYPKLQHKIAPVCSVVTLCLTLCHPMDCSPPGSSVREISQARILQWVAISFSRGSSLPRDWTHVSCISCISCISRQILYPWATWGAQDKHIQVRKRMGLDQVPMILSASCMYISGMLPLNCLWICWRCDCSRQLLTIKN